MGAIVTYHTIWIMVRYIFV